MGCMEISFAQLPKETLAAIKATAATAVASLSTLKIQKQAMSLSMDISLLPMRAKKTVIDAAMSSLRNSTNIIPKELIAGCPQIGQINTSLGAAMDGILGTLNNLSFDINQLQAQKLAINSAVAKIDSTIAFFNSIIDTIDGILG
jgi:hypothetical protein